MGSPVWAGRLSSPVRTYMVLHGPKVKNVAFFTTCSVKSGKIFRQMEELSESPIATLEVKEEEVESGKYLKKVEKWVEISDLDLKPEAIVGDAREVSKVVGEHDIALLWGLTMPHFDAFDAVKLFTNVALTLSENGVFLLEETDRVYGILYQVGYKDMLVETKTEEYALISVHEGYDPIRGVFKRTYYKLPGFEKVTEQEHRLWDLASQLALGNTFFREHRLISKMEHGVTGVSNIIYLKSPRKKIAKELEEG